MKKYVLGLNISYSGSAFGMPKINQKAEIKDIDSEKFKKDWKGCLYGIGDSLEEAKKDASDKLERYKRAMRKEFGNDFILE